MLEEVVGISNDRATLEDLIELYNTERIDIIHLKDTIDDHLSRIGT